MNLTVNLHLITDAPPEATYSGIFIALCVVMFVGLAVAAVIALAASRNGQNVPRYRTRTKPVSSYRKSGRSDR